MQSKGCTPDKRDDKFDDDISYGVGDIFEVLDCQQSCWLVRNSRGLLASS
jgi:hypothetical protein